MIQPLWSYIQRLVFLIDNTASGQCAHPEAAPIPTETPLAGNFKNPSDGTFWAMALVIFLAHTPGRSFSCDRQNFMTIFIFEFIKARSYRSRRLPRLRQYSWLRRAQDLRGYHPRPVFSIKPLNPACPGRGRSLSLIFNTGHPGFRSKARWGCRECIIL